MLATVATGMYIGVKRAELMPFGTRLNLTSVWEMIVYALNGVLFLLMGLQFRSIWNQTSASSGPVLLYGAVIAAIIIGLRFCWIWPAAWLPRMISPSLSRRDPMPSSRHVAFISWAGIRGSISLAAALSLPLTLESRPLIVFITACVIAATLLVQGTTLPWIIRLLRLDKDAAAEREEMRKSESQARLAVAAAAVQALGDGQDPLSDQMRRGYEAIANRIALTTSANEVDVEARMHRQAITAERRKVLEMHRGGEISDVVHRRIERDLDLREALLENRLAPPE